MGIRENGRFFSKRKSVQVVQAQLRDWGVDRPHSRRGARSGASMLARGVHFDTIEPRLLLSADLIPVAGTIEVPGETDYFTFELTEERQILFDALTNDSQMTWSLTGPGGELVAPTSFTSSDGAQGGSVLSLDAGTYTLQVDGVGDRTGDYRFRLLNLANAGSIDLGTPVTGVLEENGRETDLFQFHAEAGTRLFFDSQTNTNGTAYWQLIDPDGATVFGPAQMNRDNDRASVDIGKTGIYTLLLEGYVHNGTDMDYRFTVDRMVEQAPQAITLDSVVSGSLDQAGEQDRYTFSVAEDTLAFFDVLKTPNDDIRVNITGPAGPVMSNVELRYADGWYRNPKLQLVAGDYEVTVGGTTDARGNYAFQILTAASAQTLVTGERIADTLSDKGSSVVDYRADSDAPLQGAPGGMVRFREGGPGLYAENVPELNADAFTLETWVKPTADRRYDVIAMRTSTGSWDDGFGLYLDGAGNVIFFINLYYDAGQRIVTPLQQNVWSHIAATYTYDNEAKAGSLKLYVNGELAGENTITTAIRHADVPLRFGRSDGGHSLRGALDEIRFWTRARSADEIRTDYDRILQGNESGLLIDYGLDEGQGIDLVNRVIGGPAGHFEPGPGTETRLLKLSAAKGDRLVINGGNGGNVYTRIFDLYGNEVLSARYLGDLDPLVIPGDGDYLILIEGQASDSRPRNFSYLVMPESRQELSLTVGEVIDSEISAIGESDAYTFTLEAPARLYFDQLTSRSDITWSLYGPRGTEVDRLRFDQSDSWNTNTARILDLPAGDYTLLVDANGMATGRYAFRLFNIANATVLNYDPDTVVDALLSPGNATEAFRFTTARGDQFNLVRVTDDPWVKLLDPIGRQVFNNYLSNFTTTTARMAGDYLLLVEGYPANPPSADRRYQFKLVKEGETTIADYQGTGILIGERVDGTIGQSGEIDDYLFSVTQETDVIFDPLAYGGTGTVYWTLNGPAGTLVDRRNFYNSDSVDQRASTRLHLVPGTYQVRIQRYSTQTGDYAFRLVDLSQATTVDLDTAFSGSLSPRAESDVYEFEVAEPTRLYLEKTADSGRHYDAYYRVFDSYGRQIRSGQHLDGGTAMSLVAGRYTLLIEGRIWDSVYDGQYDYTLELRTIHDTTATLALGDTIEGQLGTPFDSATFDFSLSEPKVVVVDNLRDSPYAQLVITGPGGYSNSRNLRSADGPFVSTPPVLYLVPGDYRARIVSNNNTQIPPYAFRLLDVSASATTITLDQRVEAQLDPATETDIYQFDASAGQVVTLTGVSNGGSNYNAYYRLLDPYGNQIVASTYLQNSDPITLPRAGTYTLLIEAYGYENPANITNYAFTLQDPQDPAPRVIQVGEVVSGTVDRSGQRHRMTLEVTEATTLYLDSLINGTAGHAYYTHLVMKGPGGVYRDYRLRDADSYEYPYDVTIEVVPGTYELTLYIEGARTGDYAFALKDLAAEATSIQFGERVQGVLDPRNETDIYAFQAQAGDSFLMDVTRVSGASYGVYWRLIDPRGNNELSRQYLQDRDLHTLKRSGTYYLLIEGRSYEGAGQIQYGFVLQDSRVDTLDVDLDSPRIDAGIQVVRGPGGANDTAAGFSGFERIVVDDPVTRIDGDLSFSLWFRPDRMRTTWLPLIAKENASLQYGREYSLWMNNRGRLFFSKSYNANGQNYIYSPDNSVAWEEWNHAVAVIDRSNGQMRLYLNGQLAGTSGISGNAPAIESPWNIAGMGGSGFEGAIRGVTLWRGALTDGDVEKLYAGEDLAAEKVLALPLDEAPADGRITAVTDTGPNGVTPQVIDYAADLQGSFTGRLELPGQVHVYRFSLAEERLLYWDTLSSRDDIYGTLRGPGGVNINRRLDQAGDTNFGGNYAFLAPAGDYTLTIDGVSTAKGAYGLRLLDLGTAEPVAVDGSVIEGTIDTYRAAKAFRFDANAGDRIFVDMKSLGIGAGNAAWRLLDPWGRQAYGPVNAQDIDNLTLAFDGSYTLILEGDRQNGAQQSLTYRFALYPIVSPAQPITLGGPNPGGEVPVIAGAVGNALDLRGAEYLRLDHAPEIDLTGNLTLELWINPDRFTDGWMPLLVKSAGTGHNERTYSLWLNANGSLYTDSIRSDGWGGEYLQTSAGLIKTGEWTHVAAVFDRADGVEKIYVNGVEVASRTIATTPAASYGDAAPLLIGWSQESDGSYGTFNGAIDEIRLWSVARTAEEIAASYQSALQGDESGLALYLPLDGHAGGVTPDAGPHDLGAQVITFVPNGITGTISGIGQELRYTFSLTEDTRVYVDSLTPRSDLRMKLTGPNGTYLDRHFAQVDAWGLGGGNPVLYLHAGDYTLTIQGAGDALGDFNLNLVDLADATPMAFDSVVSGELTPASRSRFYQFDATAGQQVFIDSIASTGSMVWRLIDPFGRQILGYSDVRDIVSQTLPYDGRYLFIVEGDVGSGARSTYSLAFWEKEERPHLPLTLGEVTSVAIPHPGDYQRYDFSLTAPTRLYMDSLAYLGNLRWNLQGPDGFTLADRAFSGTDARRYSGNPLLELGPGDYQLTLYATDGLTGTFPFRLLDVDAAKSELFFNDETLGILPEGNHATQVFFLNGRKHQRFSLDVLERPAGNTSWRLIGPSGQQVVAPRYFNDEGGFVLPEDGEYLFLLEGDVGDAANDNRYRFALDSPSYPDATGDNLEAFGAGSTIGHVLVAQTGFTPIEEDDGAGNTVLRLLDPLSANTLSGIAFSQTAEGPFDQVRWSFDYRIEPPASGSTGQGFSTEWLAAGSHGAGGAVSLLGVEPNRSGAIGVALDLAQDGGEGSAPHISLHYGSKRLEVPLSDLGLTLADLENKTLNLEVILDRVQGGVTVTAVGREGSTAITFIDGYFLGGFDLTDGRVLITGQSASQLMGLTVDNVAIDTTPAVNLPTVTLGEEINGALNSAGAVDRYAFTLTQPTRVVVDPRTNNGHFYWSLSGPSTANGRFDATDGNNGSGSTIRTLRPGDYSLNIYSNDGSTGSYAIALLDLDAATPVDLNTAVNGTIDPPAGTRLYRFDWPGGKPFYLKTDYLNGSQNFYYRIVRPDGSTETERRYFNNDYETGNLSQAGTYYLLIEGAIWNTATGDYSFQIYQGTATTDPLTLDTITTGTIENPLDRHVYTFSLAEDSFLHLDGQTPDYRFRVTLSGPSGTLFSNEMRRSDAYYRGDSTAIWAPAGDYTLTIDPTGLTTGDYSFAVRRLDQATPIVPGEQVDATYDPGSVTRIFSFSGTKGERYYLDFVGGNLTGRWKILNPYGTLTTRGDIDVRNDHQAVTLNATGTFYLMIEGDVNATDARTHSFRLLPLSGNTSALTLGERVAASIGLPGETQSFTFDVGEKKRIYVDIQSPNNGNFHWVLSGPRGTVSDRAFTQSDSDRTSYPPFFELVPGSYTLTVYANSGVTGDFALQVLDLADATPITIGTPVSGQLAPGSETDIYTFEGKAGERYFFDSVAGNGWWAYWRVLDPYGREILERYQHEDQDTTTLQETGTYTILIEGRPDISQTHPYTFNIYANPISEPVVLAVDARPAPDLTVDSFRIDSPAPIVSGSRVDVSWVLRNSGNAPVDATFNTRLTIRRQDNGAVLADVVVPVDASGANAIAENSTLEGNATLQLPPGATAVGDLRLSLRVDVNNDVVELNADGTAELNNGADIDFTTELAPNTDLVASDLTVTPSGGWQPGEAVQVAWTVTNQGTKEAAAPWTERLVVTNTVTGRVVESLDLREQNDSLAAGESRARNLEFGWPWGPDAVGSYRFDIIVDALDEVFETNLADDAEANNAASTQINSAPDLVVSEVRVAEAEPQAGGDLTISWTIRNEGAATTPGDWYDRVRVKNLTTGQTLHLIQVAAQGMTLAPGEEGTQTVTLSLPEGSAGVGTIRVEVVADRDLSYRSYIIEARDGISQFTAENNNDNYVDVVSVARPYPNLVASFTGIPASARGGDVVPIAWRVANTGDRDTQATAWTDRVYISSDTALDASDELLAAIDHAGALAQGADYAVSTDVRIPVGLEGDYYLLVSSDDDQAVLEPDTRADNIDAERISLTSPYSDLTVQTVVGPTTAASAGDTVTVAWRVANEGPDPLVSPAGGWTDRVYLSTDGTLAGAVVLLGSFVQERDLGVGESYSRSEQIQLPAGYVGDFFVVVQTNADGAVFEGIGTAPNLRATASAFNLAPAPAPDLEVTVVDGPDLLLPGVATEVSFTVTNVGEATARAPWTDEVLLTGPGLGGGRRLALVERTFNLEPGAAYQATVPVTIPGNLAEEDYRISVRADRFSNVFEGAREANNTGVAEPVGLHYPNLGVTGLTLPNGPFQSGDRMQVGWTVENRGTGEVVTGWTDRLWLSRDDVLDNGDILLGERVSDAALPLAPGDSAAAALEVTLPIDVSGPWQLLVETDADDTVVEPGGGEQDNLAAASLDVALAPYADLVVTELSAPNLTVDDPALIEFSWTVANQGTGAGITDTWVDRLFVSRDQIIGDSDDIELGRFTHTGGLAVGESYSRTESIYMPPAMNGRFTLYVTTDAGAEVFENELEANNTRALDGFFDVVPIPYADLVVTDMSAPANAQSGQPVTLHWSVKNQGIGLTNTSRWDDVIYLADNPDGNGRIRMGTFGHIGFLAPGDSYQREAQVTLPDGWEGPAYFFVEIPGTDNPRRGPYEFVFTDEGNLGVSNRVDVSLTPPPNLVVTEVIAPAEAPEGSAIDVTWTVKNTGSGPAEGTWTDRLYLRNSDTSANEADIPVGSYTYTGPLQANTSYSRREQVVLPSHTSDRYDLIVVTDYNNDVYEHVHEDDNESAADTQVLVTVLPRPDLQVSGFEAPDQLTAGATGSLRWTVINQGPKATDVPNWTDSVYLSLDDKVTYDDIRLGSYLNEAALAPGESYRSQEVEFRVPERFRGTVYLLVDTDSGKRVDEWPNEENNLGVHELYVEPIPFADLVMENVVTPFQAFEGNQVTVNYTVTNRGAGPTNIGHWAEQIWLTLDKNRPHPGQGDVLLKTLQYNGGILEVGAGYDRQETVTLPDDLVSGNYYITPWVDPYGTVLEDPLAVNVNEDDPNEYNSNNYKAGTSDGPGQGTQLIGIQIIGNPPPVVNPELEMVIDSVTPLARAGIDGQNGYEVAYTLTNHGDGPAAGYRVTLALSDTPSLSDAREKWYLGGPFDGASIPAGGKASFVQKFELPPGLDGSYLLAQVQQPGDTDPTDDQDVVTTDVASPEPNLVVSEVIPPSQAYSGEPVEIGYSVVNDSEVPIWSGTGFWRDQVWLSKDPVFDWSRATLLATEFISNATPLAPGEGYTRTVEATLPPGIEGDYYIYVFTNVPQGARNPLPRWWPENGGTLGQAAQRHLQYAFEDPAGTMGSARMPVIYAEPDLKVTNLQVPESLAAGQTVDISFEVTNVGNRATREDRWTDRVYLSLDSSLDEGDFLLRREVGGKEIQAESVHEGGLAPGESYTATVTVTLPFELEGDFYVLGVADSDLGDSGFRVSTLSPRLPGLGGAAKGAVREFQGEGNNTTAQAVTLSAYNPPNLQVTSLDASLRAVRGQAFDISYTVTNQGGAVPFQQEKWDDLVYLSRDAFLDLKADRFLGSIRHVGGLGAGESYEVSRSYTVPTDLPTEAYYVFVVTDPNRYGGKGAVFEGDNETDNARHSDVPMIIELPPPTDLQVSSIELPASARAGEPVTIRWTVTNASDSVVASGRWTDSVFLSEDGTWDLSDRPIGKASFSGELTPGESYTLELQTTMPASTPGGYRAIVRTDIFNQVYEAAEEANNTTASADVLDVTV
ncbi:MAG: LEPR-XLL domain-containing protein, partial [Gammaproteobacteria bacterium]